jgi:hypothetical protein
MATITIRATDSAAALEEVMRLLGPEALILSTRQHGGQIEMIAQSPAQDAAQAPAIAARATQTAHAAPRFENHLRRALRAANPLSGAELPIRAGRIVLAGPPGAGCSMLAARLAAEMLRSGTARPVLIAPRPDILCPPGSLAGWARLLGLVPHRPIWAGGQPGQITPPDEGECQILDLSSLPPLGPDALGAQAALPEARLWLVLPAGLHPAYQDRLCEPLADIADLIALTRTDLCPATADDISLPDRHGLPIGLTAGGAGLLDALAPWADPARDSTADRHTAAPAADVHSLTDI